MREKLETLSLVQLREFAKAQGLRSTGLRKAELIDLLVEAAEKKPEIKPQEVHSAAAVSAEEAESARAEARNNVLVTREGTTVRKPRRDSAEQASGGNTPKTVSSPKESAGRGAQNRQDRRSDGSSAQNRQDRRSDGSGTQSRQDRRGGSGGAQNRQDRRSDGSGTQSRQDRRSDSSGAQNRRAVRGDSGSGVQNRQEKRSDSSAQNGRSAERTDRQSSYAQPAQPAQEGTVRESAPVPEGTQTAPQGSQPGELRRPGQQPEQQPEQNRRLRTVQNRQNRQLQAAPGADESRNSVRPETAETVGPEQLQTVPDSRTELRQAQPETPAAPPESPAVRSAKAAIARDEIPLDIRSGRPLISLETGDRQAPEIRAVDSGKEANGILEIMQEGYGFIRSDNYLPGENDAYVAPAMIRRFNLKTGDIIRGHRRVKTSSEKFASLLYITSVNGYPVIEAERRPAFENLTPVFPNERIRLENGDGSPLPLRVIDLLAPIGKGQRGMIVSPPKAGKTTLLKAVAKAVRRDSNMHLIILLIDERPEEVTDMKEEVTGDNVEVIYSTFDELPERHKRVSEMVIERAKRLVEYGKDVTILLDSITRLSRAYNLVVPPSGRTLSGGLDPAALHMPKRFFGAARNMREGGSLTILATALIDTGSRMDDVIYEEFKGTGNMELVLDRKLSEKRIFPAIDILKSGTRRDDLLLAKEELRAVNQIRSSFGSLKPEDSASAVLDLFARTRNNAEFIDMAEKKRYF